MKIAILSKPDHTYLVTYFNSEYFNEDSDIRKSLGTEFSDEIEICHYLVSLNNPNNLPYTLIDESELPADELYTPGYIFKKGKFSICPKIASEQIKAKKTGRLNRLLAEPAVVSSFSVFNSVNPTATFEEFVDHIDALAATNSEIINSKVE